MTARGLVGRDVVKRLRDSNHLRHRELIEPIRRRSTDKADPNSVTSIFQVSRLETRSV